MLGRFVAGFLAPVCDDAFFMEGNDDAFNEIFRSSGVGSDGFSDFAMLCFFHVFANGFGGWGGCSGGSDVLCAAAVEAGAGKGY